MTRKPIVISSLILIAIAVGALAWTRAAQGLGANLSSETQTVNPSDEELAIRETILRARRIDIEAEYTFDTSKFATVYINDPRGGELTPEALARIQEIRQDATIRMEQVGLLDYVKVNIENLKREYDNYIAELRAKQAAGTLNEEERLILEGETYRWPAPAPEHESAAAFATQTCERFIARQMAYRATGAAYPEPAVTDLEPETAYPGPEAANSEPVPIQCPTPTPKPVILPLGVPYRGEDPATLPPEAFEVDFLSIRIDGEVAQAVVYIMPVTSEYVLVKVDGQWYIAGTKFLEASP